jgi:hypothetical protein
VNDYLQDRRKAAYALNTLCREIGLGTMAERFDPEDPREWAPHGNGEFHALKNGSSVAHVQVLDETAIIAIENCYRLIRGKHITEFDPTEHGFYPQKMDWKRDPEPYVIHISLPEDIPGLNAPNNPVPRSPVKTKPRVIRAL